MEIILPVAAILVVAVLAPLAQRKWKVAQREWKGFWLFFDYVQSHGEE